MDPDPGIRVQEENTAVKVPESDADVSVNFAKIAAAYCPSDKRTASGMTASMSGLYEVRRARGDSLLSAYEAVLTVLIRPADQVSK